MTKLGTMPEQVMTSIDQVTAEWLTTVLVRSNALTRGAVAAFDVDTGGGNWSTNARLTVRYTDEAQGTLPRRVTIWIAARCGRQTRENPHHRDVP